MTVIVPLYDVQAAADAWHHVRAPGGYEWWHLAAGDVRGDWVVSAHFFAGFPLDVNYAARYSAYRRRPTRRRPPMPDEFSRCCVKASRAGKVVFNACPAGALVAEGNLIRAGDCSLERAAGEWRLKCGDQISIAAPPGLGRAAGQVVGSAFDGLASVSHCFSTAPPPPGRRMRMTLFELGRILVCDEQGGITEWSENGVRTLTDEIVSPGNPRGSPGYPELIRLAGFVLKARLVMARSARFAELVYGCAGATALVQVFDPPAFNAA